MNTKIREKVFCWESDSKGNPTGNEKTLLAESTRWAMKHLAYELGGKISATGRSVITPDGNVWYGTNS